MTLIDGGAEGNGCALGVAAAPATIGGCTALARARLPAFEADLLAGEALGVSRATLLAFPERTVEDAARVRLERWLERRVAGEPVAYILGEREFWSLPLRVDARALVPRPETEGVVEAALERAGTAARMLDLGTGCGAIALALAAERPAATVLGVDNDPACLALARENAARLGSTARFRLSDWYAAITGECDVIVSNPPYIAANDPHLTQGDLRFEPQNALVGGPDGLAALRRVVGGAPARLAHRGWLIVEHGCDQGEPTRRLFRDASFGAVETLKDLAGLPRVTLGCKP